MTDRQVVAWAGTVAAAVALAAWVFEALLESIEAVETVAPGRLAEALWGVG